MSAERLTISEVTVGKYVVISLLIVTRDLTMIELARAVTTMMAVLSPLSSFWQGPFYIYSNKSIYWQPQINSYDRIRNAIKKILLNCLIIY